MNDIATVKDLIKFLKSNFNPKDKLTFFDEGGAWCELTYLYKSQIGDWMFKYVKDKRQHELDNPNCHKDDVKRVKEIIKDNYKSVEDNGVVIY